jgi:hypothetical protein
VLSIDADEILTGDSAFDARATYMAFILKFKRAPFYKKLGMKDSLRAYKRHMQSTVEEVQLVYDVRFYCVLHVQISNDRK